MKKEIYENFLQKAEKAKDDVFSSGKYYSLSIVNYLKYHFLRVDESDLEEIIDNTTTQININDSYPLNTKLPWWISLPFGFVFPFIYKEGIFRKIRDKEWGEWDGFDCLETFANASIGTIFLDGLHPCIFPIRLFFISPITEKLRSLIS